jgi:ribosome biogenesis GTPase / thiamine phosphate phosphatase
MEPRSAPELSLEQIGWSEALARSMPEGPGLTPARVVSVYATRVDVWAPGEDGALGQRHALVRGRALREAGPLGGIAVGDWAAVRPIPGGEDLVLEAILPRRSAFVRQAAGDRAEPQAIAANIDRVFVVTSVEGDFNPRRLERYLVAIRASGAEPAIVLSKADLAGDADSLVAEASAFAPTLLASARTGRGLEALRAAMPASTTSALVGSSGVGKSALVNRLLGREAQAEGEVREHDRRGRHTTTRRDVFLVPSGGLLVDTPGMRELKPWLPEGSDDHVVDDAFEDVAAAADACRYRDCRHAAEPGCAVRAAVDAGTLDPGRLASWKKLEQEREARSERQAVSAQLEENKQKTRARSVALRARLKTKGR